MSNISQKKRAAMLAYLAELKQVHNDDESIRALNEIEAALTEKKYGLVWERGETVPGVDLLTYCWIITRR